jgi:PadR family transcriptional regulator, regulatory protein PadR
LVFIQMTGGCMTSEPLARVSNDNGRGPANAVSGPMVARAEVIDFTLREFLVLGVLKEREMCGSAVVKWLSALQDFGIPPGTGVVYPLLKNLVRDGALDARRTGGTPRIYYRLTDQGNLRLRALAKRWATLNYALQSLVDGNTSDHE